MNQKIPAKERIYFIEYKGKQVLFSDYSGVNFIQDPTYFKEIIAEEARAFDESEAKVLGLAYAKDTRVDTDLLSIMKEHGKKYRAKVAKDAIYGLSTVNRIFVNTYNMFVGGEKTRAFESKEAALEFLVKD